MDVKSINGLEEIVARTERLVGRFQRLDRPETGPRFPSAPSPLTLAATEGWIEELEECCRKPRIGQSKRLLREKGVETASIPADVMENPASITEILSRIDALPSAFIAPALGTVASALTKGFDDAEIVVESFETAVAAYSGREGDDNEWIPTLVAKGVASDLDRAAEFGAAGRAVVELCKKAIDRGIYVDSFSTLSEAKDVLGRLANTANDYDRICIDEGISADERAVVKDMKPEEALDSLISARAAISNEQLRLRDDVDRLKVQLELLGIDGVATGSTVAELREQKQDLKRRLTRRRKSLQTSLGTPVFRVIESIAEGVIPAAEEVTDSDLGAAMRKAIQCGYNLQLEPPREDQ